MVKIFNKQQYNYVQWSQRPFEKTGRVRKAK